MKHLFKLQFKMCQCLELFSQLRRGANTLYFREFNFVTFPNPETAFLGIIGLEIPIISVPNPVHS